jgi:hypothetical protein
MRVVAFPNQRFPPAADALALADAVLSALDDLPRLVLGDSGPGQA